MNTYFFQTFCDDNIVSICINVHLCIPAEIILAILLIIDSVLLFGSITRQKVALIVGIVFSAIAILCLTIIAVISFATLKVTLICVGIFTTILIAFKLWTLLIVVGSLQEVKLEIKPKNCLKMSDLQP